MSEHRDSCSFLHMVISDFRLAWIIVPRLVSSNQHVGAFIFI